VLYRDIGRNDDGDGGSSAFEELKKVQSQPAKSNATGISFTLRIPFCAPSSKPFVSVNR
jgi:hypothetical protein